MGCYINLFLFFISSSLILVSPEYCTVDSFKAEPGFDIKKFLGLWYQVQKLTDPNNEETFKDMIYDLKLNANGSTTMHIAYWAFGDSQCTVYSNLLSSTKIPGKMQQVDTYNDDIMNFWVVKTDYISYAVIYGCIHEEMTGNCSDARVEILSRNPHLPDHFHTTVHSSIRALCVNPADIKTIPQNNVDMSPGNMAMTAKGWKLLVAAFVLVITLFTSITLL
ncbi:hypothetical protein ACJMK2_036063 [Sinanodonta woodiana]|uniref:Lipocalin/cytosolic fatty-acid binding domain-containing protein n=1 Tax=Sinanodonta woodiana TaxID=1069815 RepID=A0ABD3WG15_SINWO